MSVSFLRVALRTVPFLFLVLCHTSTVAFAESTICPNGQDANGNCCYGDQDLQIFENYYGQNSVTRNVGDLNGDEKVNGADFLDWMRGYSSSCPTSSSRPIMHTPTILNGEPDRRLQTLVVFNENALDAREIAEHYLERRGIPTSQLCPIKLPAGVYVSWEDFLIARSSIISECICSLIPPGVRPSPCDSTNLDSVAEHSPINHLTMIRGVPLRLTNTGFLPHPLYGDVTNQEPPFDFLLSNLLYNELTEQNLAQVKDTYKTTRYLNRIPPVILPSIDPSQHRLAAIGRIDGITKERAKDLIDRTIDAENLGFQGTILYARESFNGNERFFVDEIAQLLTDESKIPACVEHLESGSVWPDEQCRIGLSADGKLPGQSSTIPRAINTGLYLGSYPYNNSSTGFNGSFSALKKWRKTAAECIELCSEFPTQSLQEECRSNSTDVFRELNTECVGGAPGFMGHQARSYTVRFFGFYPPGWSGSGSGAAEMVPPRRLSGGGYKDTRFNDDYFLRFGGFGSPASACKDEYGASYSCKEVVPFEIYRTTNVSVSPETAHYRAKVRWRDMENSEGRFSLVVYFYDDDSLSNNACTKYSKKNIVANGTSLGWQLADLDIPSIENLPRVSGASCQSGSSFGTIRKIRVQVSSTLSLELKGVLDLDGIELIDVANNRHLYSAAVGSFSAPYVNNLISGDYAANAIERLGAIAWWGSSSHANTGGHAYIYEDNFLESLFKGLTLGESLQLYENLYSGIFYGDPLYNPSAVSLYVDMYDGENRTGAHSMYGNIPESYEASLRIRALHGRGRTDSTRWALMRCAFRPRDRPFDVSIPEYCDESGLWEDAIEGHEAVYDFDVVNGNMLNLLTGWNTQYDEVYMALRLRVWNDGEEQNALYSPFLQLGFTPRCVYDSCWYQYYEPVSALGSDGGGVAEPFLLGGPE